MIRLGRAALAMFLIGSAPAFAHDSTLGELTIHHPWSRATPHKAEVAAGYLLIENEGTTADRLVGATFEQAGTTQIHTVIMDGDVMKMVELKEGIEIPAGGRVELKPKSLHLMFMDLKAPLKQGETIDGTLTFERAGTVAVEFSVEAPIDETMGME
jgi:hypothetical protein